MSTKLFVGNLVRQQRVTEFLDSEDGNRRRLLLHTLAQLRSLSGRLDPRIQVHGRIKTIASISDKMYLNAFGVHQVLDIVGVRAITRHTRGCYQLVELVHREFEALDAEYDDYISVPKPNGYRSIHTTVLSPSGFPVEIQVRTRWMDALSERGPAAHSRYKQNCAARMRLSDGESISASVAWTRDSGPPDSGESDNARDGDNPHGLARTATSDHRSTTSAHPDPSERPHVNA
jgi:(p)ppGpp synthase/HD superfamily hydrolase